MSIQSGTDPLIAWMQKNDIPVTRSKYIGLNWGSDLPAWTIEHEASMPEHLQDWSAFHVVDGRMALRPGYDPRD